MHTESNNGIFHAIVTSSDAATFNVQVQTIGSDRAGILQGIPLSSCLATFLGFKESVLPQVGAKVLCYPVNAYSCYILGVIPEPDRVDLPFPVRSILGAGDGHADKQNVQQYDALTKMALLNQRRPTDIVEGDYSLSNEFGVLFGLFQQFACLKASELAQIQVHVLDDLVRIVSHNFQHFSALGEYKIFHDGKRLHLEYGATHLPTESLGGPVQGATETAPSVFVEGAPEDDDSVDFWNLKANAERLQAVERLKCYMGALGDFLNILLVKPTEGNQYNLDGTAPAKPDSGLANLHLGTDGGIHFRSVKEVFIEKSNWIRVPQRVLAPEDPTGDDAENITYPNKKKFVFDKNFTFADNPYLFSLQLRDYLVYTQEGVNYANFKAHAKDFTVNDDKTNEVALTSITKVDPNTEVEYVNKTAGVYLMNNGGIVFKDAWGSSIVMEGGNVYIQPVKDVVLQPLRNLVAKVGKFTSIASKRDIDLSSTSGGFRLKTEKSQHLYSSKSGLLLQSDAESSAEGTEDSTVGTITDIGGIVLKSKQGIYNFADNMLSAAKSNIIIQSDTSLLASAKNQAILASTGTGGLTGIYSTLGSNLILAQQAIEIATEGSALLAGKQGTTVGLEKQSFGVAVLSSTNKVPVEGALKPKDVDGIIKIRDDSTSQPFRQQSPIFRTTATVDNLKFKFLKTAAYGIDDQQEVLPQTLAQQEDAVFSTLNLQKWEENAINESFPFPGSDLFKKFYATNDHLDNFDKVENDIVPKLIKQDDDSNDVAKSLDDYNITPQIAKLSLNEYKVMN